MGLPMSSLNCDRSLRSGIRAPETVMSTCGQITDGIRPYTVSTAPVTVAPEPAMTSPGRWTGYGLLGTVKAYAHRGLG